MPFFRDVRVGHRSDFRSVAENSGFLDAESVMARAAGEPVKAALAERQVHRVVAADGRVCYLKRYFRIPWREALRDRVFGRGWRSAIGREWAALERLRELNVPSIEPLVRGEELCCGFARRGYLLTLGLEARCTLEHVLKAELAPPLGAAGRARKRRLLLELAGLLRRMHAGGLNHRDFYVGHILVGDDGAGGEALWVIDLNRADVRRSTPRRWRVKDLAALHFSAPGTVSATDRLRFLIAYLDGGDPRSWTREITEKALRMRRHARRMMARGRPNFHVND